MTIFYGCSDFTSFAHLPSDVAVMISAATYWKYGDRPVVQSASRFQCQFLDSGGFGFNVYGGGYPFTPDQYIRLVEKFQPDFFATMDYPCEPHLDYEPRDIWDRIDATVDFARYLLNQKTSSICIPVIQGWEPPHYDYCIHKMEKAGIVRPYMAVGSVCMRKRFADYARIVEFVWRRLNGESGGSSRPHHRPSHYRPFEGKVKLHFFGLKIRALKGEDGYLRNFIDSLDTCAWLWGRQGESMLPRKASEKMMRFHRYHKRMDELLIQPYQLAF